MSTSASSIYSAAYSGQLSIHRSSICLHLGSLLAQAGNRQRDMQERRTKGRRTKETWDAGLGRATGTTSASKAKMNGEASQSLRGSTKGLSSSLLGIDKDNPDSNQGGGDVLSTLTPEQMQAFESENSELLKSLETDLASVQQAEQKLYAISELQTQLIQHLGQQTEMTDRLLEESITHTAEVGQGNTQLQKAKERSREASRMLCVFLIGRLTLPSL